MASGNNSPGFVTLVLCVALSMTISTVASAGAGRERLDGFFSKVQSITADFTQTVQDALLATIQETSGRMLIQRPNKFRWDYRLPYEQIIVGDGEQVWLYDIDLEQVTVKPMDDALGQSPALLLSGEQPLENNFIITELGDKDGYEWLELVPRKNDSGFERMILAFDRKNLRIMELLDSLGQTTRIQFTNIRRNPVIASKTFVFTPPQGVDVIGGRQP